MENRKTQDWKMKDHILGQENAGAKSERPDCSVHCAQGGS